MITTVVFGIIFLLLKLINIGSWDWQFPSESWAIINDGLDGIVALNHYFALDTFMMVFFVMLGFEFALFIFRFILGIVSLIRGSGSVEV